MPISNSIKSPSDLSTSFFGSADETTSSSIKSLKSFASTACGFIKDKIPINLRLLFNENRLKFGLFIFTCVVAIAAVLTISAVALSLFSAGLIVPGVILSVATVGTGAFNYLNIRRCWLNSDSELKAKSVDRLHFEYNECEKENEQFEKEINSLKSKLDTAKDQRDSIVKKIQVFGGKYTESTVDQELGNLDATEKEKQEKFANEGKRLKKEKPAVEYLIKNINSKISKQQQKIKYNESRIENIKKVLIKNIRKGLGISLK